MSSIMVKPFSKTDKLTYWGPTMVWRSKFISMVSKALQGLNSILSLSLCPSPAASLGPRSTHHSINTSLHSISLCSYPCLSPCLECLCPHQPATTSYRCPCLQWNLPHPSAITRTPPSQKVFLLHLTLNLNECLSPLCFSWSHLCIPPAISPSIYLSSHPFFPLSLFLSLHSPLLYQHIFLPHSRSFFSSSLPFFIHHQTSECLLCSRHYPKP